MPEIAATIGVDADFSKVIQKANTLSGQIKPLVLRLDDNRFTGPLGSIRGGLQQFNKALDASNARVISFGASAGILYSFVRAFTSIARSTIDIHKSLTEIGVVLNTSTEGLNKFGNSLFDIAKNTGQSFKIVSQAALELSRQGLSVEETLKRTRDALILTRFTNLDAASSVEALTTAINSFDKAALTSTQIVNKLFNVDTQFAVSSRDLAEALSRVGSTAQDAGVGIDSLIGLVTSAKQITGRDGPVIGNSFKTIFQRLQRPEVLSQLEKLGVLTKDVAGNLLPVDQILISLARTYNTLAQSQQNQVTQLAAGVFQANIFKALLNDLAKANSVYTGATNASTNATNQAIQRNQELNKTLSALVNESFANLTKAGASIGKDVFEPFARRGLSIINALASGFNFSEPEGFGEKVGSGILKGIGSFLAGPGAIAILGILGRLTFKFTKDIAKDIGDLTGLNRVSQERANIEKLISGTISNEPALIERVKAGQLSVLDAERAVLNILNQELILRERLASISTVVAKSAIAQNILRSSKNEIITRIPTQSTPSQGTIPPKKTSEGFIPNFANKPRVGIPKINIMGGIQKSEPIFDFIDTHVPGFQRYEKFLIDVKKYSPEQANKEAAKIYGTNALERGTNRPAYGIPQLNKGFIPNFIPEQIKFAALKYRNKIFTGSYHGEAYEKMSRLYPMVDWSKVAYKDILEGFVTSSNKFLTRKETEKKTGKFYSEDFNLSSGLIPNFTNPNFSNFIKELKRKKIPNIVYDIQPLKDEKGIYLNYLEAKNKNKGSGSLFMSELTNLADKYKFKIKLFAQAQNIKGALNQEDLEYFYSKYGFDRFPDMFGDVDMIRKPTKTKFSGHIPIESSIKEKIGAYQGGYTPGQVKETNIKGLGKIIYNTAEKIKQFPGLEQPAIIPPKQSKAGINYKKEFKTKHGFDPYKNKGYIPNLATFIHGTSQQLVPKILKEGLLPSSQTFVRKTFPDSLYRNYLGVNRKNLVYVTKERNMAISSLFERAKQGEKGSAILVLNIPNDYVKKHGIPDTLDESYNTNQAFPKIPKEFIKRILTLDPKRGRFKTSYKTSSGFSLYYNKGLVPNFANLFYRGTQQGYNPFELNEQGVLFASLDQNIAKDYIMGANKVPFRNTSLGKFRLKKGLKILDTTSKSGHRKFAKIYESLYSKFGYRFAEDETVFYELRNKKILNELRKQYDVVQLKEFDPIYGTKPIGKSIAVLKPNLINPISQSNFSSGFSPYMNKGLIPNFASNLHGLKLGINKQFQTKSSHAIRDVMAKQRLTETDLADITNFFINPVLDDTRIIRRQPSRFGTLGEEEIEYLLPSKGERGLSGLRLKLAVNPNEIDKSRLITILPKHGVASEGLIPNYALIKAYHGTKQSFDKFSYSRLGENSDHPSANLGFYFSSDPKIASTFATGTGGNIRPSLLNIKKPFEIEAKDFEELLDFWGGSKGSKLRQGANYDRSADFFHNFRERLQAEGYDALRIKGGKTSYPELISDNWVVFEPNQIKSIFEKNKGLIPNFVTESPKIIGSGINRSLDFSVARKEYLKHYNRLALFDGLVPNYALKPITNVNVPGISQYRGKYGRFTITGSPDALLQSKFQVSWLKKEGSGTDTFEQYVPEFKKDLNQLGMNSVGFSALSDEGKTRRIARERLFNRLIKKYASSGIIPNFNALSSAIQRENSAGIPMSQIRVGQSSNLKSNLNPLGLGVYNTKDEPLGLNQGIKRTKSMGLDPKRAGFYNKGLVPSFAFNPETVKLLAQIEPTNSIKAQQIFSKLIQSLESGNKNVGPFFSQLKNLSKTLSNSDKVYQQLSVEGRKLVATYQQNQKLLQISTKNIIPTRQLTTQKTKEQAIIERANRRVGAAIQPFFNPNIPIPPIAPSPFLKGIPSKLVTPIKPPIEQITPILFSSGGSTKTQQISTFRKTKEQETAILNLQEKNRLIQQQKLQEQENQFNQLKSKASGIFFSDKRFQEAIKGKDYTPEQLASVIGQRQQRSQAIQNRALITSFVAPMIGETLAQFIGTESKTQRGLGATASGLGNIASFAALGASFGGLPGLAVGGTIGLLTSLPKIFEGFTDIIPDLTKEFDRLKGSFTEISNSTSSYIQISERLREIQQGNIKATVGQVALLKGGQKQELAKIFATDRNFGRSIFGAVSQGSLGDAQTLQIQFEQLLQQNLQAKEGEIRLQDLIKRRKLTEENKEKILGTITVGQGFGQFGAGGGFGRRVPLFARKSTEEAAPVISNLINQLLGARGTPKEGQLQGKSLIDFLTENIGKPGGFDITNLQTGSADDIRNFFNNTLKEINAPEIFRKSFQNVFSKLDISQLEEAAKAFDPTQLKLLAESIKLFEDANIRVRKATDDFTQKLFESAVELESFNKTLQNSVKSTIQSFNAFIDRQKTAAAGFIDFQENFASSEIIVALKNLAANRQIQNERTLGVRTAGLELGADISQSFGKTFSVFQEKIFKEETERKRNNIRTIELLNTPGASKTALEFAAPFKQKIEEILGIQNIDEVNSALSELTNSVLKEKQAVDIKLKGDTSNDLLRIQSEFLANLFKDLTTSGLDYKFNLEKINQTLSENLNAEKQRFNQLKDQISIQRQISFGGGIESLLEGSFEKDLLNAVSFKNKGLQTGNTFLAAQGALQLGDILSSLQVTDIGDELRNVIVKGTADRIRTALRLTGLQTNISPEQLARTQVENRFKTAKNQEKLLTDLSNLVPAVSDSANISNKVGANLLAFTGKFDNFISLAQGAGIRTIITNIEDLKETIKVENKEIKPDLTPFPMMDIPTSPFSDRISDAWNIRHIAPDNRPFPMMGRIENPQFDNTLFPIMEKFDKEINEQLENKLERFKKISELTSVNFRNEFGIKFDPNALPFTPASRLTKDLNVTQTGNKPSEQEIITANAIKLSRDLAGELKESENKLKIMVESGKFFSDEIAAAVDEVNELNIKLGDFAAVDFKEAFFGPLRYGAKDFVRDFKDEIKSVGGDFKSGLSGALKDLVRGKGSIGEVFREAALNFLYKRLDFGIDQAVNQLGSLVARAFGGNQGGTIVNQGDTTSAKVASVIGSALASFFGRGKSGGGIIKSYSQGGLVTGGSGTKDDVPALLTEGEYVISKAAIERIKGSDTKYREEQKENRLRFIKYSEVANKPLPSLVREFSTSTSSGISALFRNAFVYNDPRRPTSAAMQYDRRLSEFALMDENNPQNINRLKREETFYSYIKELNDYIRAVKRARQHAQSQKETALYTSVISAVVGAGLSSINRSNTSTGTQQTSSTYAQIYGSHTRTSPGFGQLPPRSGGYNYGGLIKGYAMGGRIFGGQSPTDNIPVMLTDGEYVVKKDIVRKFGKDYFDRINYGTKRGYAEGGLVGSNVGLGINTEDISNYILKLIDITTSLRETINRNIQGAATANNNQINRLTPQTNTEEGRGIIVNSSITINIDKNGNVSSNVDNKTNQQSNNQEDIRRNRELTKLIEAQSTQTIIENLKPGGLLYGNRERS